MICKDISFKQGVDEGRIQTYKGVCDVFGVPEKGQIMVNGYIMSREGIFQEIESPLVADQCTICHIEGIR
jgi:hypothetical protein